jgi:hypothetical protein
MTKNRSVLTFLFVICVFLSGCAATPRVLEQGPPDTDLSRYKTVVITVEASDALRQQEGYDATSTELLNEFVSNLKALGKYAVVSAEAGNAGGLDVRLTITRLNYVHGAARGLFGIVAGRAVLDVTMTVKDKDSGAILRAISADHASHHGQGVFSPTTSRQVAAIAKDLAAKL